MAYAENSDLFALDLFKSEAFAWRFSEKKETTSADVSFLKKLRIKDCNIIKKKTATQWSPCEFCKNLKKIFFTDHIRMTASVKFQHSAYFF